MGSITIRRLDERVKRKLKVRAAQNGRSMEDEARVILGAAVAAAQSPGESLVQAIRRRIEPLGGVELDIAPRERGREPPTFD